MPSRLEFEPQQTQSASTLPAATGATARYDAATQQKIIALASHLQQEQEHDLTLTAEQIAAAGAEVGLAPAFVQEAVARLEAAEAEATIRRSAAPRQPRQMRSEAATTNTGTQAPVASAQKQEQRRVRRLPVKHIRSRLIGLAWAVFLGMFLSQSWNTGPVPGLTIPALAALTAWLGAILGSKRAGFWTGAALVFVTLFAAAPSYPGEFPLVRFVPLVFLMAAGGLTGALGAFVAQKRAPREAEPADAFAAGPGEMNRAALLDQMFALQRQLAAQKRRAAFLSVDVVGSSQIKQAARTTGDELAVEHAFGQYHRWVEQIVAAHGGRVQAAAGDGVMCLFEAGTGGEDAAPETRAVRAARDLQNRLADFNAGQGAHLAAPLRIRCGVSAGEVAIEAGAPVGHLQSVVIDRAAALQKRAAPGDIVVDEASALAALTELGALAPLSSLPAGTTPNSSSGGDRGFSWQAAHSSSPPPGNGLTPA